MSVQRHNVCRRTVQNYLLYSGTPNQVYEKIMDYRAMVQGAAQLGVFSYGGMPHELALHSYKLFVQKVLPRLKEANSGRELHT